jgi:hypothetical protein
MDRLTPVELYVLGADMEGAGMWMEEQLILESNGPDAAAAFAAWREARTLALHRLAIDELRKQPHRVAEVRAVLGRWLATSQTYPRPALNAWEMALDAGLDAVIALASEDSEQAAQVRKSSPLLCVIDQSERSALIEAWAARKPPKG